MIIAIMSQVQISLNLILAKTCSIRYETNENTHHNFLVLVFTIYLLFQYYYYIVKTQYSSLMWRDHTPTSRRFGKDRRLNAIVTCRPLPVAPHAFFHNTTTSDSGIRLINNLGRRGVSAPDYWLSHPSSLLSYSRDEIDSGWCPRSCATDTQNCPPRHSGNISQDRPRGRQMCCSPARSRSAPISRYGSK